MVLNLLLYENEVKKLKFYNFVFFISNVEILIEKK